jgi:hypothetical protein
MGVALGWVLLALAQTAAMPPAGRPADEMITYQVRYVEADGIGWREGVFNRLKPVARQGAATIWTVSADAKNRILAQVKSQHDGHITQAPRVTAFRDAVATIHSRSNKAIVTQVAWTGAEPKASENVRVGWHTTMVGRKLDQGVLVRIVLEDTEIRSIHHVNLPVASDMMCPDLIKANAIVPANVFIGQGKAAGMVAIAHAWTAKKAAQAKPDADECGDAADNCDESECCAETIVKTSKDPEVHTISVDVPEIASQEVAGEWLIPNGESLLVSFGAYTVADASGKAVVKERLAIIDAAETAPFAVPDNGRPTMLPTVTTVPPIITNPGAIAVPKLTLPVPAAPSRSFPQGFHADGKPAELPKLPEDEPDDDADESAEPRPSPQTKKPAKSEGEAPKSAPVPATAKPSADASAKQAEFVAPKAQAFNFSNLFIPGAGAGLQFLMPIKPFSVKLPFNQRLQIEVLGRVVPDTEVR